MDRRLIYGALMILGAIGIAIAIYFVFFRPTVVPVIPREEEGPAAAPGELPTAAPGAPGAAAPPREAPVELPEIAAGGPTLTRELTAAPVKAAQISADGKSAVFYSEEDGKFYRALPDGSVEKLSDKRFPRAAEVVWSPGADKAVIEFPDGANLIYDFKTGVQTTLPKHWEDFDFSPDGKRIVAKSIGIDPDNRWLIAAGADGSRAEAVAPLGENADRVRVEWSPSGEVVAFSATGRAEGFNRSEVYLVGLNNENFKSLTVEGRDFRPLWAPDGERVLYSVYSSEDGYRPQLWIVDGRGDNIGRNRQRLGIRTWADKCAFTVAHTVYCAVPVNMPEGYGLQPSLAKELPDQIFKIDTRTGAKTVIGAPAEGASISGLQVSADESVLFYTNARTGRLRQLRLR